jgi:hypothetical protein
MEPAVATSTAPSSGTTVLMTSTPGKAPSSAAKGASGMRWCKVFDPDKQIFVMRPMRVSRCP